MMLRRIQKPNENPAFTLLEKMHLREVAESQGALKEEPSADCFAGSVRLRKLSERHRLWAEVLSVTLRSMCFLYCSKQMHRELRARKIMAVLLMPMLKFSVYRKRRRVARKFFVAFHKRKMARPAADELRKGELFYDWPKQTLDTLIACLTPTAFMEGETITHQGERGMHLYVIDSGTVQALARKIPERRGRFFSHGPAMLMETYSTRGSYFGEFPILVDEPFPCTMKATSTVRIWVLSKLQLLTVIAMLPVYVRTRVNELEARRRRDNMWKLRLPSKAQMRAQIIFTEWDDAMLDKMVAGFEPEFHRSGSVIISKGDVGDCMYFVARGQVAIYESDEMVGKGEPIKIIGPPTAFGEIAIFFVEKRCACCVAHIDAELWRVPKTVIMDIITIRPDHFMYTKYLINKRRAEWMTPLEPSMLSKIGILPPTLVDSSSFLAQMHSLLLPAVFGASDFIIEGGKAVDQVIILQKGTIECTYNRKRISGPAFLGSPEVLAAKAMWSYSWKAVKRCDCWVLTRSDIIKCSQDLSMTQGTAWKLFSQRTVRYLVDSQIRILEKPTTDREELMVRIIGLIVQQSEDEPVTEAKSARPKSARDAPARKKSEGIPKSRAWSAERSEQPRSQLYVDIFTANVHSIMNQGGVIKDKEARREVVPPPSALSARKQTAPLSPTSPQTFPPTQFSQSPEDGISAMLSMPRIFVPSAMRQAMSAQAPKDNRIDNRLPSTRRLADLVVSESVMRLQREVLLESESNEFLLTFPARLADVAATAQGPL